MLGFLNISTCDGVKSVKKWGRGGDWADKGEGQMEQLFSDVERISDSRRQVTAATIDWKLNTWPNAVHSSWGSSSSLRIESRGGTWSKTGDFTGHSRHWTPSYTIRTSLSDRLTLLCFWKGHREIKEQSEVIKNRAIDGASRRLKPQQGQICCSSARLQCHTWG